MQQEFWLERWKLNQIGFHNPQTNRHLKQNWSLLNQPIGSVIFVPFCGKSQDMLWLRNQGYQVIGVELSPLAVEAFFIENELSVKTVQQDKFKVFETNTSDSFYKMTVYNKDNSLKINYFNFLNEIFKIL